MNNKQTLEALAMDLKRVALGYFRESSSMAEVFVKEALKRKDEIDNKNIKPYLNEFLNKIEDLRGEEKGKAAEDALLYSIIFQNASKVLFEGTKVYYSGSIRGVANPEPDFAYRLVNYMIDNGADVLSEHVGARTTQELNEIFLRKSGVDRRKFKEPWCVAREIDMRWVDEATHVVAVVNGPSHGVGMEIERAILKPQRGLPETPILCLIQEESADKLTWMIKGVSKDESPDFYLKTYKDIEDAKKIITNFLVTNR